MKEEIFKAIRKEASDTKYTWEVVRRNVSRATMFMLNEIRGTDHTFMSSCRIVEKVFMHKMGVSKKELYDILELGEQVVFDVDDAKLVFNLSISRTRQIIDSWLERGVVREEGRVKYGKRVYTLSERHTILMGAYYRTLLKQSRIKVSSDFISEEIEKSPYWYGQVLKHNRSVSAFKRNLESAKKELKNGKPKKVVLCKKKF